MPGGTCRRSLPRHNTTVTSTNRPGHSRSRNRTDRYRIGLAAFTRRMRTAGLSVVSLSPPSVSSSPSTHGLLRHRHHDHVARGHRPVATDHDHVAKRLLDHTVRIGVDRALAQERAPQQPSRPVDSDDPAGLGRLLAVGRLHRHDQLELGAELAVELGRGAADAWPPRRRCRLGPRPRCPRTGERRRPAAPGPTPGRRASPRSRSAPARRPGAAAPSPGRP